MRNKGNDGESLQVEIDCTNSSSNLSQNNDSDSTDNANYKIETTKNSTSGQK